MDQDQMLNSDTYSEYLETSSVESMIAYLDAVKDIVQYLSPKVSAAKNFDELKKEMEIFLSDRTNFYKEVKDHLISQDPKLVIVFAFS